MQKSIHTKRIFGYDIFINDFNSIFEFNNVVKNRKYFEKDW